MPNKYVRMVGSRKYRDFSDETLEKALNDIKINNLTFRKASAKYACKEKKIDVPAGRSVALEDIKTTEENKATSSTSQTPAKMKKLPSANLYELQDTDSENDQAGGFSSNDDEIEEAVSSAIIEPNKIAFNELEIDDFVIVELQTVKGRRQRFIGKIIHTNPHRCSFLKESTKTKNAFIFPAIPDEGDIEDDEYILKLTPPTKLRRGPFLFYPGELERYLHNYN
ncbi:hypothetical protein RN001_008959 [Aquatica leii]|uniref:Uncharacterized protein n=1 Tax=Aquatica leii TaxID=1421715 RepID=A0AAN7SPF5_9COLE|nr:hypothetical protein RN001_008959 [Aquatica leii]